MLRSIRHSLYCISASLLMTASIGAIATEKEDAPLLVPGTTKIIAEEIFELAEKYPDLIIIDARIRVDRNQGYIQGSVSLPDIETNCDALAAKIPKKESPVLFYCNGVKCGRSVNSSKIAMACGYTEIYWFRGGYEEWEAKSLPFIKQ